MFTFAPGHFAPVTWQPTGGAAALLNIKDHNVDISVLLHDVTGTSAGGVRARLAGPTDASGKVDCDLDLDAPPYASPPLILPGISGICAFGFTPAKALQLPMIVEVLHFVAAVDKEVTWSTDMKMNSRAGLIVYPAL